MTWGRASFEIQTLANGHWITQALRETQSAAQAVAKGLLAKDVSCQGARVVKNWQRADGLVTETVVFEEMREATAPPVVHVPIEDAPYCRKLKEYYGLNSRLTLTRLFRNYIEKVFLTPVEVLHNYRALARVQEVDTLFPGAVDRVSSLQARDSGREYRERRDEVYRAVARMTARARRADGNPAMRQLRGEPMRNGDDFARQIARVNEVAPPDEIDYYALTLLCGDTISHRSWLSKFERLGRLLEPRPRAMAATLLDTVSADLVAVPSALRDLLGPRQSLADALIAMADLTEGRHDSRQAGLAEALGGLAGMIGDGTLEQTRLALIDRIQRHLGSGQPLNRAVPNGEADAFTTVIHRLYRPSGLLGGGATAAALTKRFLSLLTEGGKTGLRKAVGGVAGTLPDPRYRVIYLGELASTPLGQTLNDAIGGSLRAMVNGHALDTLLKTDSAPPAETLNRICDLFSCIAGFADLPEADKDFALDRIDQRLAAFLGQYQIVERLDDPAAPLCQRAPRLVRFCFQQLPVGSRTRATARERVVALLRQPNFAAAFVASVMAEGGEPESALRDLYASLRQAGFREALSSGIELPA